MKKVGIAVTKKEKFYIVSKDKLDRFVQEARKSGIKDNFVNELGENIKSNTHIANRLDSHITDIEETIRSLDNSLENLEGDISGLKSWPNSFEFPEILSSHDFFSLKEPEKVKVKMISEIILRQRDVNINNEEAVRNIDTMAKQLCPKCNKPLGYGVRLVEKNSRLQHLVCVEEKEKDD